MKVIICSIRARLALVFAALLLLGSAAQADMSVELSAEASRPASNDLFQAVVFAESSATHAGELARRINGEIGQALKLIRSRDGVSVKSGQQSTFPVYGREQKLESWRMRSELILESRDLSVLTELLGQLQQMRLALASITPMPSPETRRQVEHAATRDAIAIFRERAAVIAEAIGKSWKISRLVVHQGGGMPMPQMRGARVALAEALATPIEAGETRVTVTVSGQISVEE